MSVSATPSITEPAAVGVPVQWDASVAGENSGNIWYRFRIRDPCDNAFRTVRDYSPLSSFSWMPGAGEGSYDVEITARNQATGATSITATSYLVVPRITGSTPVITATNNKLVYLYSAAACAAGSEMRVSFTRTDGFAQATPWASCDGSTTMNTYLAGLRAQSDYTVRHTIVAQDGSRTDGPELSLSTGALTLAVPATRPLRKSESPSAQPVLFQNRVFTNSIATDPDGNVLWYYAEVVPYLTRPEPGGFFFALVERPGEPATQQLLRQIDLAGNVVFETNAARVNEQLVAMGRNPITSFHHEARRLPDRRILVLAATERILADVQGDGEVVVIGDTILVLNEDLEVVWAWDSFDHLDMRRMALLDEKCRPGQGGCPSFGLGGVGNDWLHGNSLSLTPDGNIIYSARHQDWVVKVNYANGLGSGEVLWRLGKDGDFQPLSDDPAPWFSHQHDANIIAHDGSDHLLVFDNANVRAETDPAAHSRGQLWRLDENARTAELVLNFDLGDYAFALGSAQQLENGNYEFGLGILEPNRSARSLEFDRSGNLVSLTEAETAVYRAHRMRDMYTP